MSIYTVVPRADQAGFDVSVIGDEGVRHTMLGFKTEADAKAWSAATANGFRDGGGRTTAA